MNCLEFRSRLSTDPRDRDADLLAHREACPACAAFAADTARFEANLVEAARLPLPPALTAHLVLNQTLHHARRRRMLASAAMLTLVVASGAAAWWWHGGRSLEAEVLAHIRAEPEALAAAGPVAPGKLAAVLYALGARFDGETPEVHYAGICDIRRHPGAHIVLAGNRGPVTVLLLPAQHLSERRALRDDGLEGMVLPADGGSIAIVGVPGEPLEALARQLRPRFAI